jgi:hypothetical protein
MALEWSTERQGSKTSPNSVIFPLKRLTFPAILVREEVIQPKLDSAGTYCCPFRYRLPSKSDVPHAVRSL